MIQISIDSQALSEHISINAEITSDKPFYACEARATPEGTSFGRGIGLDLLGDDAQVNGAVAEFESGTTSFAFDIEANELSSDGEYRVSVFTKDENGVWDDCAFLITSTSKEVYDSNGCAVKTKRTGGTEISYTSAYSGDEINNFVSEVMG